MNVQVPSFLWACQIDHLYINKETHKRASFSKYAVLNVLGPNQTK